MKKTIVIGVMLGIAGLGQHALAQTLKPPHAIAAQTQDEAKPSADELITLLKTKGILTETEAALFRQTELLPEIRQVLAEMLLSKQLISKEEYDETLCSCSDSAAQAEAGSQHATPSILGPNENGEPGRLKSFSDWIASILPGGGQTSDLDFGTIQPSPMWPQGDHAARTRAQTKPAADELITLLKTKGILTETEAALFRHTELLPETRQVLAEMLLSKHLISRKEYDRTLCSCSNSAAPD